MPATAHRADRPRRPAAASWSGVAEEPLPRPLQVKTSARRRPGWPASRRAQVLVGGGGVAHVELHGRARPRPASPTAMAPASRSAPSTLRTRKSPRPKSTLVLVDDDAEVQAPLASGGRSSSVGRRDQLVAAARARAGRRARATRLPLGAGDDERLADRPAALRHDGARSPTPAEQRRRPRRVSCTVAVEHEPVAAGLGRGRRHAADDGEAGAVARPSAVEDRVDREARTGRRAAAGVARRRTCGRTAPLSARPDGRAGGRRGATGGAPPGRRAAHRATAGSSSTSRGPPSTGDRGRTRRRQPGRSSARDRGGDVLDRADVGRRARTGRRGRAARPALEDLADDLAGGVGGAGVLGEGGGEGHGVPVRRADRGAACRARS